MKTFFRALAWACGALVLAANADQALRQQAQQLFGRIEAPAPDAVASPPVELGRKLFWDERISADGKTACASCHLDWGADNKAAIEKLREHGYAEAFKVAYPGSGALRAAGSALS